MCVSIIPSDILAGIPQGPQGPQGAQGPQGDPWDVSSIISAPIPAAVGASNLDSITAGISLLSGTISLLDSGIFYTMILDLSVGVTSTVSGFGFDLSTITSFTMTSVAGGYSGVLLTENGITSYADNLMLLSTANQLDLYFGSGLAPGTNIVKGSIMIPKSI